MALVKKASETAKNPKEKSVHKFVVGKEVWLMNQKRVT